MQMKNTDRIKGKQRYPILDEIRGINLISMILFHASWDLVYIFGVEWRWFHSDMAYWWQQCICWIFILLSGFCWSLGQRKMYRGCVVFGAGVLISVVTEIFMPDQRIRFGVLTLLGTGILLTTGLEKLLQKVPAVAGLVAAGGFFFLTRNINEGFLGFEGIKLCQLPAEWYQLGDVATFFGLADNSFYSTDYFSLFPWYFLFLTGYFGYRCAVKYGLLERMKNSRLPKTFLGVLGRKSLLIYLLHQPIIYLVLMMMEKIAFSS